MDSEKVRPAKKIDLSPYIDSLSAQGTSKTKTPSQPKETFKCQECKKEFLTQLQLEHHRGTHGYANVSDDEGAEEGSGDGNKHKFVGSFNCHICGKENHNELALNSHYVSHFG